MLKVQTVEWCHSFQNAKLFFKVLYIFVNIVYTRKCYEAECEKSAFVLLDLTGFCSGGCNLKPFLILKVIIIIVLDEF